MSFSFPQKDIFIFLETNRVDENNTQSYFFSQPSQIITCNQLSKIKGCFVQLESVLREGNYVAGFICYEAGYAFEPIFARDQRYRFPLLWFGVFKKPQFKKFDLTDSKASCQLTKVKLNICQKSYRAAIKKIKKAIEEGETYQVNYTSKYKFNFRGSPFNLYSDLRKKQKVPYSAFMHLPGVDLLSFSPELFFRKIGNQIEVKPMKGTFPRGKTIEEDALNAQLLKNCPKNQSENIMIVDLLRNDLGKICETGSLKVNKLFEIEKYESLYQMTSSIQGKLMSGLSFYEIFKNIFPSGSVTGAPKIKTMQIIRKLERGNRKLYTGSIGFITPARDAVFNVAIRTVWLEGGSGEMGVGSGVVYDSQALPEYEECQLKARFLLPKPAVDFKLIETLLWSGQSGFAFLGQHLERLKKSVAYFDFCFPQDLLRKKLEEISLKFKAQNSYKVRIILSKNGGFKIEFSKLTFDGGSPNYIALSSARVDSKDIFYYHKTTNRRLFDFEYESFKKKGCYDVIFRNEKGQITEGTISNIFIKINSVYYTPPQSCGLLAGVFRNSFIEQNKARVKEKVLFWEDILAAPEIYLSNSVRGLVRCFVK